MSYERRPDRRPGGQRGGFGRPDRPQRDRPPRDRMDRDRPPPDRDRGPRDRSRPYTPRPPDEGGMAIRLDPRRLSALKLLAAEAGVRPGELVTQWVQERLDAARGGRPPSATETADPGALAALAARVDQLAQRLDELESQRATAGDGTAPAPTAQAAQAAATPEDTSQERTPAAPSQPAEKPKRAARQRKSAREATGPRVPLHEEIAAVINEQGPMTAGELATAIRERGRYAPPRSAKPLDAATVNARVSNPVYRSRFVRSEGRIGLANAS
ncbi:MAG TPA: hypothetical protein VHK28_02815 [Candidatus Limnocylindria bacterium]|nr:hypothetical protein [Candidatus Limnocylindria bacterium]